MNAFLFNKTKLLAAAACNIQMNANATMSRFDEQLMREEVRLMAEKICWQLIPDITEKIVREEITKLISNIDKSI